MAFSVYISFNAVIALAKGNVQDMSPKGIEILEDMRRLIQTSAQLEQLTTLSLPVLNVITFDGPILESGEILLAPDDWEAYGQAMEAIHKKGGFKGKLCHELRTVYGAVELSPAKYNKTDKKILRKLYRGTCLPK